MGKEIGLLGLAFKPNTDDMREASSLVLSARLQAAGARVAGLRPGRRGRGAQDDQRGGFRRSAQDVADGADAVVLVTEWPEFGELDFAELAASMRGDLLVDGRNFLDPAQVRDAGLAYEGVGRPRSAAASSPRAPSAGRRPCRR